jgi:hypothetical protein
MATKNFTQFDLRTSLLTSDYIVGYKADGSAEYKATVKQIVDLVQDSDAQTLSFNEVDKNLSISSGNTVSLSALVDTSVDTGVRALTGNWQSTYTTVQTNSSSWNQAYDIATTYSLVSSLKQDYIGDVNYADIINSSSEYLKIANRVVPLTSTALLTSIPQAYFSVATNSGKLYFLRGDGNTEFTIMCFNDPKNNPNDITFIPILSGDTSLGMVYDSARNLIYIAPQTTNPGKISGFYVLNPNTNTYVRLGNAVPAQHGILVQDTDYLYARSGGGPDGIIQVRKSDGVVTRTIKLSTANLQMGGPIYGNAVTPDNKLLVGVGYLTTPPPGTFAAYTVDLSTYNVQIAPLTGFSNPTGVVAAANNLGFIGGTSDNFIYNITTNSVSALPKNKDSTRGISVYTDDTYSYFVSDQQNLILRYNYKTNKQQYFTTNYIYNSLCFNGNDAWGLSITNTSAAKLDYIDFQNQVTTGFLLSGDVPTNIQFKPTLFTTAGPFPVGVSYGWYEIDGGNVDVSTRFNIAGSGSSLGDILVVKNVSLTADVTVRRFGSIVSNGTIKPGELRKWVFTGTGSGFGGWQIEGIPAVIGALPTTGGTITGNLSVSQNLTANNIFLTNATLSAGETLTTSLSSLILTINGQRFKVPLLSV